MMKFWRCIPVPITTGFLIGGIIQASALPIGLTGTATKNPVLLVACKPGTKNCVMAGSKIPKPCTQCKIDTGGGDCQGGPGTICGNAFQNLGTKPGGTVHANPTPVKSGASSGGSNK
jgi:hypothetical protein